MIKVVHISTSSSGGAGRAAFRLHQGLCNETGIDSTFLSAANLSASYGENHILVPAKKTTLYHKILNRLGVPNLHYYKNLKRTKNLKSDHECFSMPETDYSLEALDIIKKSDIINLHWIANFINYPTFFEAFKNKTLVWTLHDMNPFMGGFHYQTDSLKKSPFNNLDNSILKLKKKYIRKTRNLTVVTPSQWLFQEALNSKVFNEETRYKIIQNGIDLQKFKQTNKDIAREKLGLNKEFPCMMVISDDLKNHRKGLDLFIKAIESIKNQNFQILTIGNSKLEIKGNFKLIELGSVNDDDLISLAYSAANIVVIPSREDNLPNVMLESFACGTPVLSFKVGGMLDWIIPGFNGLFADSIDELSLQTEIENFLNNPPQFNPLSIRNFAVKNFSRELQARNYSALYRSL